MVHEGAGYDPLDSLFFVQQYISRYAEAQSIFSSPRPPEVQITWRPPPPGIIKINYDASIVKQPAGANMGIVARDSAGCVLAWQMKKVPFIQDPEHAEALAAYFAADFARRQQFS